MPCQGTFVSTITGSPSNNSWCISHATSVPPVAGQCNYGICNYFYGGSECRSNISGSTADCSLVPDAYCSIYFSNGCSYIPPQTLDENIRASTTAVILESGEIAVGTFWHSATTIISLIFSVVLVMWFFRWLVSYLERSGRR